MNACIVLEIVFRPSLQDDLVLKLVYLLGQTSIDPNCHRRVLPSTLALDPCVFDPTWLRSPLS